MAKLDKFEEWVQEGTAESNLAVIQSLSMQGKTLAEIGAHFHISERQLCRLQKKHMSIMSALKNGRESVVAMCQSRLMELVKAGDTVATIYALKIYGGDFFNDRKYTQVKAEISGKGGESIKVETQAMFYLPEKEESE